MTVALVLLSGILLATGVSCLVIAVIRSTPRLDAALERIGADGTNYLPAPDIGPVRSRSERLGEFVYRVTPVPLTNGQRRALRLQNKPIAEFYADKSVMAIIGAVLPGLAGGALTYLTGHLSSIPAVVVAVGGVIGFFVPDLLLRRATTSVWAGAADQRLSDPGTAQCCGTE